MTATLGSGSGHKPMFTLAHLSDPHLPMPHGAAGRSC